MCQEFNKIFLKKRTQNTFVAFLKTFTASGYGINFYNNNKW